MGEHIKLNVCGGYVVGFLWLLYLLLCLVHVQAESEGFPDVSNGRALLLAWYQYMIHACGLKTCFHFLFGMPPLLCHLCTAIFALQFLLWALQNSFRNRCMIYLHLLQNQQSCISLLFIAFDATDATDATWAGARPGRAKIVEQTKMCFILVTVLPQPVPARICSTRLGWARAWK